MTFKLPGPSGGKTFYGNDTLNQGMQLNHLRFAFAPADPHILTSSMYSTYKKTGDPVHSMVDPSGDDPFGIWPHEGNAEYQAKQDRARAEQMVKGKFRMRMQRKKDKMKEYRKNGYMGYGYASGGRVRYNNGGYMRDMGEAADDLWTNRLNLKHQLARFVPEYSLYQSLKNPNASGWDNAMAFFDVGGDLWQQPDTPEEEEARNEEAARKMVKARYRARMKKQKEKKKKRMGYALGGIVDPRIQADMRTNEMYRNRTMPVQGPANNTVYAGGSPTFNESANSQSLPADTGGINPASPFAPGGAMDPLKYQGMVPDGQGGWQQPDSGYQNTRTGFPSAQETGQAGWVHPALRGQQVGIPPNEMDNVVGFDPNQAMPTQNRQITNPMRPWPGNRMPPQFGRGRPMPVNPVARFRMANQRAINAGGPMNRPTMGSQYGQDMRAYQQEQQQAAFHGQDRNRTFNPNWQQDFNMEAPVAPEMPPQTGGYQPMPQNDQIMYAGGSPNFDESTGQYVGGDMARPSAIGMDGSSPPMTEATGPTGMGGKGGQRRGNYNYMNTYNQGGMGGK